MATPRPTQDSNVPSSILISNVRYIFNKIEEVTLLLNQHVVNIAVFVETWLSSETPNDPLIIGGYTLLRKDRQSGNGGGIAMYIKGSYNYAVISESDVSSLISCNSEIFPVYLREFSLLMIGVYHPFWNNLTE